MTPKTCILTAICCSVLVAIGLAIGLGFVLNTNGSTRTCLSNNSVTDEALDDEETSSSIHVNTSSASYRYAAVSSDAGVCSSIGTDILARQHGSSIDAAIATLLCMGVANAHSMGIGGGFFMVAYNSSSKSVITLDAREVAPAASTASLFRGNSTLSRIGGLSVAVPGEISGYWAAHQRFGRLPWATLFQPTIKLCNEGVPITLGLSHAVKYIAMMSNPAVREMFTDNSTGQPLRQGDLYYCKKLAATLKIIAEEGESAFYNGSLSHDILQDLQDHGSIITPEDLVRYRPEWRENLALNLDNGMKLHTMPAPSGGPILTYILNILQGYNFTSEDLHTGDEKRILTYHRIVEAMKFAFAKRISFGDPSYVDISELERNMTSREQGDYIRRKIDDKRTHAISYYGSAYADVIDTGTGHLSLIDADGNAVSITSTINHYFGSRILGSRTGIIFNNEMDDFSSPNMTNGYGFPPSPANFIEPGKRPLSSMCPAILLDQNGDIKLVIGASGGSRIPTATAQHGNELAYEGLDFLNLCLQWIFPFLAMPRPSLDKLHPHLACVGIDGSLNSLTINFQTTIQVILRSIYFGERLDAAITAGRMHHQLFPPYLFLEEGGFSQEIISGLKEKGHNVSILGAYIAVIQAVSQEDSMLLYAVADARKGGVVDGY